MAIAADIGTCATAVGVFAAVAQLRFNQRQARTNFEDSLNSSYRNLIAELPIDAMLGGKLSKEEASSSRSVFYRYFDLCNEQIYLHDERRVSDKTWHEWRIGIETNIRRPAFRAAWRDLGETIDGDFQQLRTEFEGVLIGSQDADPSDTPASSIGHLVR